MITHSRVARVAVAVVATSGAALAPVATAAATASISGVVTVGAGSPTSVCVSAWQHDPEWGDFVEVATGCADALGAYTITGLDGGSYQLEFVDSSGLSADEWWDDAELRSDADAFTVPAGAAVTGMDATLSATGTVTGTVTGPDGDAAPAGTEASFSRIVDGDDDRLEQLNFRTGADGTYAASGLPAGTYRVYFRPAPGSDLAAECWQDVEAWECTARRTLIQVPEGGTVSGIDAQLDRGAVVSGTVVSDSDGLPVRGVRVALVHYDAEDGWQEDWERVTDADGRYEMTGVYPGTYRLKFAGPAAGHDVEYWDDKATLAEGVDFRVDSATSVVRDASLRKRSTISGTLTDTNGQPVPGVCAEAYYESGGTWHYASAGCTDSAGRYEVRGLTPRTYRLELASYDDVYVGEWWDDAATREAATDIVVPAYTHLVRDAVISRTSELHGSLSAPGGGPQGNVTVHLYMWDFDVWRRVDQDRSDSAGAYQFSGLQPGRYKLYFSPTQSTLGEWWSEATSSATATEVVVGREQVLTGYDQTLRPPASISGRVATPYGGYYGPTVTVYRLVDGAWTEETSVRGESDGSFVVAGLEPGTRRLKFSSLGHHTEYWQDASTLATAADVPVALGEHVTGLDALVEPYSHPQVSNEVDPWLAGSPTVGSTLTAMPGEWVPSGVSFTFQWLADEEVVPGATGQTYLLTGADLGRRISVVVTGTKPPYQPSRAGSNQLLVTQGSPTSGTPTIAGGPVQVGRLLTASPGTWTPTADSYSYTWLVDGVPAGTGQTYQVPAGAAGRHIVLRVAWHRSGYPTRTAESGPHHVALGTVRTTRKPSLKGRAEVGRTLKVRPGVYSPGGAKISYQWFADGKRLLRATRARLALKPALRGRTITARVIVLTPGYARLVVATNAKTVR